MFCPFYHTLILLLHFVLVTRGRIQSWLSALSVFTNPCNTFIIHLHPFMPVIYVNSIHFAFIHFLSCFHGLQCFSSISCATFRHQCSGDFAFILFFLRFISTMHYSYILVAYLFYFFATRGACIILVFTKSSLCILCIYVASVDAPVIIKLIVYWTPS